MSDFSGRRGCPLYC